MSLEITEVRVNKLKRESTDSKTLALVSVVLNKAIALNKIKIVEGPTGPFVSMASKKDSKGEYRDIFHPITKEFREELNKAILDEYAKIDAEDKAKN